MADINVERKGPSIWPWIIGLLVLALLIWAIAEMVDTDEEEMAAREPAERVEEPVAAVPAPAPTEEAASLETLAPLGMDDVGRMVMVEGQVVGQPTDQGFWVATQVRGEPHAIFVQAPMRMPDGQMLQPGDMRPGQDVQLMGTIRQVPAGQASNWIEQAQLRAEQGFEMWNVHEDIMLSGAQAQQPGQPGMQPGQPGVPQEQQPAQPGDTVRGRY